MSENTGKVGSTSSHPASPPTGAPLPSFGPLLMGSETVINPEGRPTYREPENGPPASSSSVWNTLFPQQGYAPGETGRHLVGLELGHFRIEDRIRSGGMGAVFRAIDTRLNRIVALKILPPSQSRNTDSVQRFRNEARAAARLDHENIARVFYIGEDLGLHFIAFEFITGTNVRDLIQQQGKLEPADAVNYTLQIANALAHASAQGVVHRDIKPSNIIITPAGRAKLVDLGLARNENIGQSEELTVAGTTLGTFDYISPEQAKDPRTVDVRSDIYSLGCTLYHMLTGEAPYPEGTFLQKALNHIGKDVPDPKLKNREISDDLSMVVRKMMASDSRRRYQTAEELMRDLMLLAGSMGLRSISPEGLIWMSSQASRPSFVERHVGWVATVAVLLLIVFYLRYSDVPKAGPELSQSSQRAESSPPMSETEGSAGPQIPPLLAQNQSPFERLAPQADKPNLPSRPQDLPAIDDNPGPAKKQGDVPDATSNDTASPSSDNPTVLPADPTNLPPMRRRRGGVPPDGQTSPAGGSVDKKPSAIFKNLHWPISILGPDQNPLRPYTTLKAACADAEDGNTIELRFNGTRREEPFRINKKITIKGGKGFHPHVELVSVEPPGEGVQSRMITVTSGSLDLADLHLSLSIGEGKSSDQWAMFSVLHPDKVRLQGVTLTLRNPQRRAAAIAEFRSSPSRDVGDTDMEQGPQRPPVTFRMQECTVQAEGDLFCAKHSEGARFYVHDSMVLLEGALLRTQETNDLIPESSKMELELDHVTGLLNGGLLKTESGDLPGRLIPVEVSASNNIFCTTKSDPLISMSGASSVESFRDQLRWTGQKNFYERFQGFWSISSTDGMGKSVTWDFFNWRKHWAPANGPANEVLPRADEVVWEHDWKDKTFWDLAADDFVLDRTGAGTNPAIDAATIGDDVGANLAKLEKSKATSSAKD